MKIKRYIVEFIDKVIGFAKSKYLSAKDFIKHILSAASHNTYVETVSNKADSLHLKIKSSYAEDIKSAYQKLISKLIKLMRFGSVDLAVDITHEQFYGKTRDFYIFHCCDDPNCKAEFHYMVISIVNADKNIPLMALPVTLGCNRSELVEELILFTKSILRIRVVLFDRGFVNSELIDRLNKLKVKYLIFAKKCLTFEYWLSLVDDSEIITDYEMEYSKDKSTIKVNTNLVLIKARDWDEFDWCFYTNLYLEDARSFIYLYKKRWQIETNFRVEDEAKIKSKTTHYLIRYFYFMMSLLLHALWLIFPNKQFKLFLINLEYYLLFKDLGIDYSFSV